MQLPIELENGVKKGRNRVFVESDLYLPLHSDFFDFWQNSIWQFQIGFWEIIHQNIFYSGLKISMKKLKLHRIKVVF